MSNLLYRKKNFFKAIQDTSTDELGKNLKNNKLINKNNVICLIDV